MLMKTTLSLEELADIIFVQFFSKNVLRRYEVFEKAQKTISLREKFIKHYKKQPKVPKYDEDNSKLVLLRIVVKVICKQETFLNSYPKVDGTLIYDFSVFDPLFEDTEPTTKN